jgi:hypothetical protein
MKWAPIPAFPQRGKEQDIPGGESPERVSDPFPLWGKAGMGALLSRGTPG